MERNITIKVCGVNDVAAIDIAISAGVSYIGCVFDPTAATCVTPILASNITHNLPKSIKKVAVVSSPSETYLNDIILTYRPDYIQFNGKESTRYLAFVKAKCQCKIIKNILLESTDDIYQINAYDDIAELIVLTPSYEYEGDAVIDWHNIRTLISEKNCMISGRISKHNVNRILQLTSATALDICASPEFSNGANDPVMLQEIINAIRDPFVL